MVASTTATLAAARFGLAPTVKKNTTAGLKLVDSKNSAGVISNDPAGESLSAWGQGRRLVWAMHVGCRRWLGKLQRYLGRHCK